MELLLRVDTPARQAADVVVEVDSQHTVAELHGALCRHLGVDRSSTTVTSVRTGLMLDPESVIADVDVMSGDAVLLGPPGNLPPVAKVPPRVVSADILAGPASGRSALLQPGRYRIGRAADSDFPIDDPSVSRHHLTVTVHEDWSTSVVPSAEAANGVTVNDKLIEEDCPLNPDDVVGLGGTRMAFRTLTRRERERHDRLGQVDFHRTPYRPPTITEPDEQEIGPIPSRPDPRAFQVFSAIGPLAAGLVMFLVSRRPEFLLLTIISPMVMIATWFEDRRTGRTKFSDELADFRREVAADVVRLDGLRHRERVERLRSAPDLADLARRAELRSLDLWPRGRSAPDFLRFRLGLGAATVSYVIKLAEGGERDLRAEVERAIAGLDGLENVPIAVDLVGRPVLGVHGEQGVVDGTTASLAVQAACLHSPEDLTIAAAISPDRPLEWMKWLPHMRSVASPLPGGHMALNVADGNSLVGRLTEVASYRVAEGDRDDDRCWPRIMVFFDAKLQLEPAGISRLLDIGPAVGISVVWLADSAADVPRQACEIAHVGRDQDDAFVGRLWSTDPANPEQWIEIEQFRGELADGVARALAPVRDASTASLATSIPRTVPLLDMLGVSTPTPQSVAETWLAQRGYHLRFPVGIGADGIITIDLVENGPHTLIGGTSGAGKSELLQSMVAALAAHHPPTRLNFLFVDYKGGASSNVFGDLPHTVGYVTNLSADLALRALTSLRAELNHRMRLMEGRAKDLAEMLEKAPDEAPASLVIIVDEFATLVKEVPEFVAGIIDIAQRGRSLGIHLVLATQRPSGSVNENILANTNLRISLRMLDRAESTSIIDGPEAAGIPVPLRGRGFLRLGPRELREFQSGYANAPLVSLETRQPVLVGDFDLPDSTPQLPNVVSTDSATSTQLKVVIEAVATASRQLSNPPSRRPWRDVLPEVIVLDEVLADERAAPLVSHVGREIVIGMLDDPATQDQRPIAVDLESDGGLLVFGSGGSGKSTLLRTMATSIVAGSADGDVAIVVFDFGSRALAALRELPDVIDVATGDDLEAVTRQLLMLDDELTRRRALLGDAGSESLTAYNRSRTPLPRIVVMFDAFDGVADAFAGSNGSGGAAISEVWGDRVQRIITDGRQVGIHSIITAARRNSVPQRVHAAVARRLILRHADPQGYSDHGINTNVSKGLELAPGRGLLDGEDLVQTAVVSDPPGAQQQGAFVADMAARLQRPRQRVLVSARLPEVVPMEAVGPPAGRLRTAIGIEDVSNVAVVADLAWSNLTVCGPPRSGRSSAVAAAALGLLAGHDVFVACATSSPLAASLVPRLPDDRVVVGPPDSAQVLLERVVNLIAMRGADDPCILVIDDLEAYESPALSAVSEQLAAADGLRLIASLEDRSMTGYTMNPLVNLARRARRLLVMQPDDPSDFLQLTGLRLPVRPGVSMTAGRGVLLADRIPTVLQVAFPSPPA